MFAAKGDDGQGLHSFDIQDFSTVKRVKGTLLQGSKVIRKLSFSKKDGTNITEVSLGEGKPFGPESILSDDEEIIGVFGTKDIDHRIYQLGFIVWKPPRI